MNERPQMNPKAVRAGVQWGVLTWLLIVGLCLVIGWLTRGERNG